MDTDKYESAWFYVIGSSKKYKMYAPFWACETDWDGAPGDRFRGLPANAANYIASVEGREDRTQETQTDIDTMNRRIKWAKNSQFDELMAEIYAKSKSTADDSGTWVGAACG